MHKVLTLSQNYILLDNLLFKLITVLNKEKGLLAVPEVCADKIIVLYHASLFAGHQDMIKTYLTICTKFFIPNLNALFESIPENLSYMSTSQK